MSPTKDIISFLYKVSDIKLSHFSLTELLKSYMKTFSKLNHTIKVQNRTRAFHIIQKWWIFCRELLSWHIQHSFYNFIVTFIESSIFFSCVVSNSYGLEEEKWGRNRFSSSSSYQNQSERKNWVFSHIFFIIPRRKRWWIALVAHLIEVVNGGIEYSYSLIIQHDVRPPYVIGWNM